MLSHARGESARPVHGDCWPTEPAAPTPEPAAPTIPKTVKAYPSLLTAFYKAELAPVGRVYQIMRAIDAGGRGWLDLAQLRTMLTDKKSPWHICGKRYFRMIMRRGNGVTWQLTDNGRVRYMAPGKILTALGAGRLQGKPVLLPVKAALLSSIQPFKAYILEAWHAGRREGNPISQHAIRAATAIPEATQRTYNKKNGVTCHRNDAIGQRETKESKQGAAFKHGHNGQIFTDWVGKMGTEGARYLSWRMPNSYETHIQQTAKGRQKKINNSIVLVNKQARGKNESVGKLYYQDSGAAGSSYNRNPSHDCYWPEASAMTRTASNRAKVRTVKLWAVLPGQELG